MTSKFGEFFRFDLAFQGRSAVLRIGMLVFGLIAIAVAGSDAVQLGGAVGNVNRNAPMVIVNWLGSFSILSLFMVGAYIGGAVVRDFEMGTAELFFAAPIRRGDYLLGRFAAGLTLSIGMFVVLCVALMLGFTMPWVNPDVIGPYSLKPYVWSMLVIVVPNLFFIGALIMAMAALTRSLLGVYVGVILFLVLSAVASFLTVDVDNRWIAAMVDPFGGDAVRFITRYWSAAQRNTQLPPLDAALLFNRGLWIGVGLALLVFTQSTFRLQVSGGGKRRWFAGRAKAPRPTNITSTPTAVLATERTARQRFDFAYYWLSFRKLASLETSLVLRSVPFLVMLFFGLVNLGFAVAFTDQLFDTKVFPVTHLMLDAMQSSFSFMLLLIVTFYAGEMVFRERGNKLAEVTDALPVPTALPLLAKLSALVMVVFAFQLAGIVVCVTAQLIHGQVAIEPLLYLKGAVIGAIPFLLTGVLALFLHVITNNKFLGYLLIMVWIGLRLVMRLLHWDHNLYDYSTGPGAPYSDMNGYGHFIYGYLVYRGYWSAVAAAMMVLAAAFWVRGTASSPAKRWRDAKLQLRGPLGAALATTLLIAVGLGGYIFYNTNVLNIYRASDTALDLRARYEKEYSQYRDLVQPKITAIRADVDIFPRERHVAIRGHYDLVNRSQQAINELHVSLPEEVVVQSLKFAPAKLTHEDVPLGYRIYRLDTPMQPGQTMPLDFELSVHYRGFTNDGTPDPIVYNGTFFNNAQYFPSFGFQDRARIVDRQERRKRDLGEVPRMAKLEDESARQRNYLTDDGDWVDFETTVSTDADQIALAPGYLEREWTEGDRRYFRYKMDKPILPFFAYLSAAWQVRRDKWKDVNIEVYYDAKHPYNIERMVEGVRKSLDYFTTRFSPYQFKQMRILEFPRYERFAQSFANTVPFSEALGFIADLAKEDAIDYVFYVTAHEVAHQWWAHQIIGADAQGSTMLSESLAQYSALMVMEHEYGPQKMRKFLRYELDNYLSSRAGELVEELPLYRVENQPYIHYRKGSLVFYRLKDEIGEDAVNRALAKFLADRAFGAAPYPTSLDLLRYIRAEAPADKQDLITELFEKITFYDNRVVEATATKRADGKFDVKLKLHQQKFHADGKGAETEVAMTEPLEIGVFARAPGASEAQERVLLLERRALTGQEPEVSLVMDEAPFEVGLDPYNKLIDRVPADNRKRVTIQ